MARIDSSDCVNNECHGYDISSIKLDGLNLLISLDNMNLFCMVNREYTSNGYHSNWCQFSSFYKLKVQEEILPTIESFIGKSSDDINIENKMSCATAHGWSSVWEDPKYNGSIIKFACTKVDDYYYLRIDSTLCFEFKQTSNYKEGKDKNPQILAKTNFSSVKLSINGNKLSAIIS